MSVLRTLSIGKNIGWESSDVQSPIKQVSLQTGWVIDHIGVNETKHGGYGGGYRGSLDLMEDEYISQIEYRYGASRSSDFGESIIFLKFTTNRGRSISSIYDGTEGTYGKLEKIKLLGIGGQCDNYVRQLDFLYLENYTSECQSPEMGGDDDDGDFSICQSGNDDFAQQECCGHSNNHSSSSEKDNDSSNSLHASHQGFILAYAPPFGEFDEYVNVFDKIVEGIEKITAHMTVNQNYYCRILDQYLLKIKESGLVHTTNEISLEKLRMELGKRLENKTERKQKIPEGYVGVMLVQGEIMKGPGETYWMLPITVPSYSIIKIGEKDNLLDYYDLTGGLDTQMPGLKRFKTVQNGYAYYRNDNV